MNAREKSVRFYSIMIVLVLIITACQPVPTPETIVETMVVTEKVKGPPVEVVKVVTPTPGPEGPRTLVICLGGAPNTLYKYGTDAAVTFQILAAVEDGPIDSNSFGYQPIILEKLPNLEDGDAILTSVTVSEGDTVVDTDSNIVTLDPAADPAIMLIPAGGGDAVAYQGGDFEMDQLSATFKLLPNLTWSDGTPLTAADSVYAFRLESNPKSLSYKYTIDRTAAYEATDDVTTVWTGLPGYMDFGYYLNFISPAPEHIWGLYSAAELLEAEESAVAPIGWGAYIIEEHVQGESITLHKNPNYFRAGEGLPKFDYLVFRITGESSDARITALLSGECDISTSIGEDQTELLVEFQDADLIEAAISTSTFFEHIDFRIQVNEYDDGYQMGIDRPDFFSDVRTRRAFVMCIDRQALVDSLLFGQSEVLDTYIPQIHPLFSSSVVHYDFDVEAGSALLEQVGWIDEDGDPATPRLAKGVTNVPNGTRLEVLYTTTDAPLRQQVSALIQSTLAECGIQANVQQYPSSVFFQVGPSGGNWGRRGGLTEFAFWIDALPPCDLYLSSEVPGPEGETWISIQDGQERIFTNPNGLNISGFVNDEYDNACNTALSSLPGQAEYVAAHHEVQHIYAEQLPSIPLFTRLTVAATRKDMCNFIVDPTGLDMWNIEEFDYGEGCVD